MNTRYKGDPLYPRQEYSNLKTGDTIAIRSANFISLETLQKFKTLIRSKESCYLAWATKDYSTIYRITEIIGIKELESNIDYYNTKSPLIQNYQVDLILTLKSSDIVRKQLSYDLHLELELIKQASRNKKYTISEIKCENIYSDKDETAPLHRFKQKQHVEYTIASQPNSKVSQKMEANLFPDETITVIGVSLKCISNPSKFIKHIQQRRCYLVIDNQYMVEPEDWFSYKEKGTYNAKRDGPFMFANSDVFVIHSNWDVALRIFGIHKTT